jgi:hypothetical protein
MTDSEMSDDDLLVAAMAAIVPHLPAQRVKAVAHEWVLAGYSVPRRCWRFAMATSRRRPP